MDYSFDTDFGTIIMIALGVGALGGLAWEIANAVRRDSNEPAIGLDNRITFPFFFRDRGRGFGLDFGFLGPLVIGAFAGAVTVLLAGRSGPDGADVVRELSNLAAAPESNGASESAEQVLATGIDKAILYPLAFLGGIAGWALLQTLASRLSSLFEVMVEQSADATAKAVENAAQATSLGDDDAAQLGAVAREAFVSEARQ